MNVSGKKFIGLPVNTEVLGLSEGFDESELVDAKCLLINMPIREQARPNNAPLGLCLLASRLKEFKVEVDILDLNSYRVMDEVAKQKKHTFISTGMSTKENIDNAVNIFR